MKSSTTLASLALAASTSFFETFVSAKPIPIGEEEDRGGPAVQLAEPETPQFPNIPALGPSRGQINIRILTDKTDTIDIDPPRFESVDVDLDPISYTGQAQFAPLQLAGAVLSRSSYPVSCFFSLEDGTTDESWVLNSEEKKTFVPQGGSLQGVTGIECGKIQRDNAQTFPQAPDMTVGREIGAPVPNMILDPLENEREAKKEPSSEQSGQLEQQQLEKAFAKSGDYKSSKTNFETHRKLAYLPRVGIHCTILALHMSRSISQLYSQHK